MKEHRICEYPLELSYQTYLRCIWHNKYSFNFGFSDGHETKFKSEKHLECAPIVEPLSVASFAIYFDPRDFVTGFRFWNSQGDLLCEAGECNF